MSTPTTLPSVKQQAREIIDAMPDDCTFEDIQYELYFRAKIDKAEESLEREGGIPHEEIKKRVAKWLSK